MGLARIFGPQNGPQKIGPRFRALPLEISVLHFGFDWGTLLLLAGRRTADDWTEDLNRHMLAAYEARRLRSGKMSLCGLGSGRLAGWEVLAVRAIIVEAERCWSEVGLIGFVREGSGRDP